MHIGFVTVHEGQNGYRSQWSVMADTLTKVGCLVLNVQVASYTNRGVLGSSISARGVYLHPCRLELGGRSYKLA